MLIPLCIVKALRNEPVPIYGDGQQVRDWLHVDDHCAALVAVLERGRPGQVYNVGGGTATANLDLVRRLLQCLDSLRPQSAPHERLIKFVEDRPGHDRRYELSADKIRRELTWSPTMPLAKGLAETAAWYIANPAWIETVTNGRYDLRRLGLR